MRSKVGVAGRGDRVARSGRRPNIFLGSPGTRPGPILLLIGVVMLTALLLAAFAPFADTAIAASSMQAVDQYSGLGLDAQQTALASARGQDELREHIRLLDSRTSPSSMLSSSSALTATTVRYDQTNPMADYSGGTWITFAATSAYGETYARTSEGSSSVTVSFYGTSLSWIATKGTVMGEARVFIDGVATDIVDLHADAVAYQIPVWETGTLPIGAHTITISRLSSNAAGAYINVDAFDVAEAPQATGSISGTVTSSGGTKLSGVYVLAVDEDGNPLDLDVTDSAGVYSIANLPNIPVMVMTQNQANYIDEWYKDVPLPGHWDGVGATVLDLGTTATRTNINFSLATGRSISGKVTSSGGSSLADLEVDVYALDGSFANWAVTDASGNYVVGGLPAGQYYVQTYNESGYIDEWYNDDPVLLDPDGASASVVNVTSGNATGKNFVLAVGRSLGGTVSSSAGPGLADVEVRVQPVSGDFALSVTTDETGAYAVDGLPAGQYVVNTANDQGYVDEWYNDHPAPGNITGVGIDTVDLTVADANSVNFSLNRGYTISGHITDEGTTQAPADPGVGVVIYDSGGVIYADGWTGGEGGTAYTTWALPAGTYFAQTVDLGAGYIDEWYNNLPVDEYALEDATPITVTNADVTGIDFALIRLQLTEYQENDPHIAYVPSPWASYPTASASGGAYARANTSGSTASMYFEGTRLDWIAMTGTTTGKADVYLDDVFETTIDLAATVAAYQVNVYSTGPLAYGLHKFSIVWNQSNTAGKYITLDRVDVLGTLVDPPPTANTRLLSVGWNLVAGAAGSNVGDRQLFRFDGNGYVSVLASDLVAGQGYWCRSSSADTVTLSGSASPLSVDLRVGWNLIGNSTTAPVTLSEGLVAFAYGGTGYTSTTTLAPGEGAWVKSATVRTIVLE